MYTQTEISERTGFDQGERFESDDDVRAYFNRDLLISMMPELDPTDLPSQEKLDEMAWTVISNHWHYVAEA